VKISVHTGFGIEDLTRLIEASLPRPKIEIYTLIPFNRGDLLNRVHETGEVISIEHTEAGTKVRARVDDALAAKLKSLEQIAL